MGKQAYTADSKSVRQFVGSNMYKFDLIKLRQTNLDTMDVVDMRAPRNIVRPSEKRLCSCENAAAPLSKGFPSVVRKMRTRKVYVVRDVVEHMQEGAADLIDV